MTEGAFIVLGVALSYWTNLACWHRFVDDVQWRLPIGLQRACFASGSQVSEQWCPHSHC